MKVHLKSGSRSPCRYSSRSTGIRLLDRDKFLKLDSIFRCEECTAKALDELRDARLDESGATVILKESEMKPTMFHSLERTSPKGQAFIGRCVQCGKEGLSAYQAAEECINPLGVTQDEALIEAIKGPTK